jgi:hypothetical protein
MAGGIATLLVSLAGPVVRKALASLGFGLVSYAAMSTALNAALSAAKGSLSGFGGDALSIVQLSGVFMALSIIAGAMVARVGVNAISKLEILK